MSCGTPGRHRLCPATTHINRQQCWVRDLGQVTNNSWLGPTLDQKALSIVLVLGTVSSGAWAVEDRRQFVHVILDSGPCFRRRISVRSDRTDHTVLSRSISLHCALRVSKEASPVRLWIQWPGRRARSGPMEPRERPGRHAKTRREQFLERMDSLISWEQLEERIRPFYPKAGRGRRPYELSAMLRIHCVQLFYNLSDPGMEDILYEVDSVRRFVGLKLSGRCLTRLRS